MNDYVVNVKGYCVWSALNEGYHAYFASGATVIEIPDTTREKAEKIAKKFGDVVFIYKQE